MTQRDNQSKTLKSWSPTEFYYRYKLHKFILSGVVQLVAVIKINSVVETKIFIKIL